MANDSLSRKIFAISPHLEMVFRRLYWNNVTWLSKKIKKTNGKKTNAAPVNFEGIVKFLRENGASEGSLLVVHSAYGPFKGRGKNPNQIIDSLLSMIGESGTLAMPAMPKFKNATETNNYLTADTDDCIYEYDVQNSQIKTGVLPLMLHKREGSLRSRHPINSMVVKGPLAEIIMSHNLRGDSPLACGKDSSWNHCVENNAFIVGLGTDLTHSLTMIHVAEDVLDEKWPIKNWYIEKNFLVRDGEFIENIKLRERAPKWGALHFGERTLCKDLIIKGILKTVTIDGIVVEILKARDLINFLSARNSDGYPYFWVKNETK